MTAQHLDTALAAVASVVAGISGVGSSSSYAYFNINERVFSLNYVAYSDVSIGAIGTKQHLASIFCDIATPVVGMTDELNAMLGIADAVTTAFVQEASSGGDMFGGALTTYENCRVEFRPDYIYNSIPHLAYRVILENITLKLDL